MSSWQPQRCPYLPGFRLPTSSLVLLTNNPPLSFQSNANLVSLCLCQYWSITITAQRSKFFVCIVTLGRTSLVIFSYLLVECMIQQYDIIITFWWLSSIIAFSRSQFLILRNFGVTVNQAFPSLPPYKTISYLPYRNNMLHQSRLRYNTADYRKEEGPDILHRSSSRPPGSTLRAMLRTSTADSHLDKFY